LAFAPQQAEVPKVLRLFVPAYSGTMAALMRFEDAADVLLVGRSAEGPVDLQAAGPSRVAEKSREVRDLRR
jgi:hypothetical protein